MIKLRFQSSDGHRWGARFTTLAGAQKKAAYHLGETPTFGRGYAVSDDGVCTVRIEGATLAELFPRSADAKLTDARNETEAASWRKAMSPEMSDEDLANWPF